MLLLGVDIGTTATKVSLASLDGALVGEVSAPCRVESPQPGWAEVDPHQWWTNVGNLIPKLLAKTGTSSDQVLAVGVAGMVPAVLCLDDTGTPLGRSLQQNDARAWKEIDDFKSSLSLDDVLAQTGSGISTQSVGPKLLWLSRHRPDQMAKTSRVCGSYDWIVRQLTGADTLEANWALESGLYDFTASDWIGANLDASQANVDWFAPIARSHEIVGTVSAEAAGATGLREGTPVTGGAADHIASAFSAGLTREGDLLVKLGGAADILFCLDQPMPDRRLFLDHHLVPDKWMLNGCMAAGGSLLRWFQRELGNSTPFADLDSDAGIIAAGSDGLICLPYFLGEKSPIQDPLARGAFVGLHLGHTRGHLYHAALEAIAFGFAHHIDVFEEHGLTIDRVRITNGGSRSRLWRQIVSDVIDRPLESLIDHPGSGLGAAFAAGVATNSLKWTDIDRFNRVDEIIVPRSGTREVYREAYSIYRSLYPALTDANHRLAKLQGDTK